MQPRLPLLLLMTLALATSGCSSLPSWMGGKKEEQPKLAGERIAVLPVSKALEPDESLKDRALTLPPAATNAEWPQHSGLTGNLAGDSFDTISHVRAGDGESFEQVRVPMPVVAASMVFAMDGVGNISAHDAAHIETIRWQSKGVSEKHTPQILDGGLAYADGKLYATSGRGWVVALDATDGHELWRKALNVPLHGAPRVADGKIYMLTLDNQGYALNAADGEVLWSHRGIGETTQLMHGISPVVAEDKVLMPYSSGELYALSITDGREIWSDSLASGARTKASAFFSGIGGDPVVEGPVVFAVSSGGKISVLALATGQHGWERPIGSINTPWLAGDTLFLVTADNTLVAMVKFDGRIRWATKLKDFANAKEKKDPITWRGPVLVNGKLAVVGSDGELLLVSAADGSVLATKEIPDNIYTPPVVADGRMYLLGQDARLYELQ